jgi:DNA-binding XRE family transcriptional regulator
MNHDLLHIQGKPYVLVPLHEYRTITNPDTADITVPEDVLDELSARQDHPVRILRKFRGLTQEELAGLAGLSRPYITEIETGKKQGSVSAIQAIATALSVQPGLLF